MRRTIVGLGLAGAMPLAGCASANTAEVIKVLGETYAHCERTVTYSAGLGLLSPGLQVSGSIKCDPAQRAAEAGARP